MKFSENEIHESIKRIYIIWLPESFIKLKLFLSIRNLRIKLRYERKIIKFTNDRI